MLHEARRAVSPLPQILDADPGDFQKGFRWDSESGVTMAQFLIALGNMLAGLEQTGVIARQPETLTLTIDMRNRSSSGVFDKLEDA